MKSKEKSKHGEKSKSHPLTYEEINQKLEAEYVEKNKDTDSGKV